MLCSSSTLCRPPSQAPKPPRSQQLHSKETGGRKRSQLNYHTGSSRVPRTPPTLDTPDPGPGRGGTWWSEGKSPVAAWDARASQGKEKRVQGVSSRGKSTGHDGRQKEKGGLGHGNQRGGRGASAQRATDLLLAGADTLGVEVPVRVEVADGHPQVLHSDHGAVGQVWEEEGSRWCELAHGGCGP